jgi:hypothetical protein
MSVDASTEAERGFVRQRGLLLSLVAAAAMVGATACSEADTAASTPSVGSLSGARSSSPQASPSPVQVVDFDSFTQALEAAGFEVSVGDRVNHTLFAPPRQAVLIDGVDVGTYEYSTDEALDEVRSSVSPGGDSLTTPDGATTVVNWVPHFFSGGRLLVLYLGHNQRTLDALELVLGPQFAGV